MTCPACGSGECEHSVELRKAALMACSMLEVCNDYDATVGEAVVAMMIALRAGIDAVYSVFDDEEVAEATVSGCKALATLGGISVELPAVEQLKKRRQKAQRKAQRKSKSKARSKKAKCPHCGRPASPDSNLCGDALMGRDCGSLN